MRDWFPTSGKVTKPILKHMVGRWIPDLEGTGVRDRGEGTREWERERWTERQKPDKAQRKRDNIIVCLQVVFAIAD